MLHRPTVGFWLWFSSVSVGAQPLSQSEPSEGEQRVKRLHFCTCNQITGDLERFVLVSLFLGCVHAWKASWHTCCQLWRDSNASGKGCVSHFQLNIFLKSRSANVCQRAPSLGNTAKICKSTDFWAMRSPTLNRPLSFTAELFIEIPSLPFWNPSGALAFSLKWTARQKRTEWKGGKFDENCSVATNKQDHLTNVEEEVLFNWRLWRIRSVFCFLLNK